MSQDNATYSNMPKTRERSYFIVVCIIKDLLLKLLDLCLENWFIVQRKDKLYDAYMYLPVLVYPAVLHTVHT